MSAYRIDREAREKRENQHPSSQWPNPLFSCFSQVQVRKWGPDVWFHIGDVYVTEAHPLPWLSEMYGYVYGAALANVSHKTNNEVMLYPGYDPFKDPYILHYGLKYDAELYSCLPETHLITLTFLPPSTRCGGRRSKKKWRKEREREKEEEEEEEKKGQG